MEPYRTCKLFGAVRVVLGITDAIALLHSPVGCAYNLRYLLTVRGAKVNRIVTTEMSEKEVIFGGEAKLRRAIREVDKRYSPNLIVVLTSCASSIIGEDVELVVRDIRDEISAEIITIQSGGFEGDQIEGYKEALRKIVELVRENEKTDKTVNLLAIYRYGKDVEEISRLLSTMGIKLNAILTAKTNLSTIREASKASLNVIMCEASGFDAARYLKERFGIDYIDPLLPVGISNTREFFESIADEFDLDISSDINKEERIAKGKIEKFKEKLNGKRVCIISGASRSAPLVRFSHELGMIPVLVSIDRVGETTLKDLERVTNECGISPKVLIEPEFRDVLSAIEDEKPDIILGGLYERAFTKILGIPICDVMHSEQLTMCYKGAINLAKKIAEVIVSSK